MDETATVDVEGFKNFQNAFDRQSALICPVENVQVLLAAFESIENREQKVNLILELRLKQSKITAVQLDPKTFSLKMFQPASPKVTIPVLLHPDTHRVFTQIVSRFLAFDPLEKVFFLS